MPVYQEVTILAGNSLDGNIACDIIKRCPEVWCCNKVSLLLVSL